MGKFEALNSKLEDDSKQYQDILDGIAGLVKITTHVQHLKDEAETKKAILNKLPRNKTEPKLSEWLRNEHEEDNILKPVLPIIPNVDKLFIKAVENTAGSSTGYIVTATNALLEYQRSTDSDYGWVNDVHNIVDDHTNKVQQRTNLPERLNKLNRNLGDSFRVVQDSYVKSQNKIAGIDTTAIQMRDILDQIWGGLLNVAREKNTNPRIQIDNLELRKSGDRNLISEILNTGFFPKHKLSKLLDDAYKLSSNLSDRHFGKDPLNENREKLNLYHSQWISIIDDISGIVV